MPYPRPSNLLSKLPSVVNLALYAGDGASTRITLKHSDGSAVAVGDGTIVSQIRSKYSDPEPKLQFNVDVNDASSGVVILSLTGEQTASLIVDGKKFSGYWDLQFKPTNGEPMTLIRGKVTCDPDVTKS